jgi:DNA replication protein DnaC
MAKHIRTEIQKLEAALNLTNTEINEPYILTKEEEEAAINNQIMQLQDNFTVRMKRRFMSLEGISEAIAKTDWESKINRDSLLQRANSNKHYQVWQQQQRENEKLALIEKQKQINETWTAMMMLKLIRWTSLNEFGKQLIENEHTMRLIKIVCLFLAEDARFEEMKPGYSLNKGLLLRGISGIGKTHIVRCAAKNERNPVSIHSMIEIAEEVKSEGEYDVCKVPSKKIYLDDVGSETPTVKHYGTEINWFKDFLETFYLRSQQYNKLIVSTNCNHAMLEERYGFRVRSRIMDMFNVVDVKGTDLRGL